MSCLLHYLIQYLNYLTEIKRIKTFQQAALKHAWGPTAQPTSAGQKKKIRMTLSKLQGGEDGDSRGPLLDLLVHDDQVYLLDEDSNGQ